MKIVGTFFYVGLLRPAPGTWGSLAALPVAYGIHMLGGFWLLLALSALGYVAGIIATRAMTAGSEDHDPSYIVIDEVHRAGAASYEKDPEERKEMLTFVVAGGGFTGVELVGELIEWLPILCKDFGVDYDEVTLMNVEALGNILNMLPDKPRNKAIAYMKKKGVIIRTQSLIVNADEKSFTIKDGTVIKTRTLVWTCGVRGTSFCNSLDLADGKVQRKKVDQFMKSPDYDNVYLAGDGIWFMEDGRPVPQIVEAAEQTAATAAQPVAASSGRKYRCRRRYPQHQQWPDGLYCPGAG